MSNSLRQAILLTKWKLNNVVFHFDFGQKFKFDAIPCNKDFSYEPELFPAALISKFSPVHITLFINGKGMITGVKNSSEAIAYLVQTFHFLRSYNDHY